MASPSPRARIFRPVAAVFGTALIAAGVLKVVAPGVAAQSPITAAVPPWVLGLVPPAEVVLGLWLVSGIWRFGAWAVALPVAGVFAAHSLLLTLGDRPTCGCLGKLVVPPAVMLAFDSVVAALLVRGRPEWRGWPAYTPAVGTALRAGAVTAGFLLVAWLWGYGRYGSVEVAVAAARGRTLAVTPSQVDLGTVEAGATVSGAVRLTNLSGEPVQVALLESGCACAAAPGLPVTVGPGESADLEVVVAVGPVAGSFRRAGWLRTTLGDAPFGITALVRTKSD